MRSQFLLTSWALAMFTVSACSGGGDGDQAETKIVGGYEVLDATDPTLHSTVALMNNGSPFCTGTIIGPNHVVTAAHCINGPAQSVQIGFGSTPQPMSGIQVVGALAHPEWVEANDIAIVAFQGTLQAPYKPVKIAPLTIQAGVESILAGYGTIGETRGGAGILRRTSTPIARFNTNVKEFELQEGDGKGSCYGDSGGPAYVDVGGELMVIGATSRGRNCDLGNGIYADVRMYTNWMSCEFQKMGVPLETMPDDGLGAAPCFGGGKTVSATETRSTVTPQPAQPPAVTPAVPANRFLEEIWPSPDGETATP